MSKMGSAGQDVLTRENNPPTPASDNKLYTHTDKATTRLRYQKLKASKEISALQDSDIGTFWGRYQSTLVNRYQCFLQVVERMERGNPITKSLWIALFYQEGTKIKSL